MKIGIITFHFPYNCGAVLQCVALQNKLQSMGHEVVVINYKPWYHQNRYIPKKNPMQYAKACFRKRKGNVVLKLASASKGYLKVVKSWKNAYLKEEQDRKFQDFINRNLNVTKVYRTLKALQKNAPKCDLYISGSDQLWNTHITDGRFDEAYFMNFGDKSTKRVTYSVGADFSECKDVEEILTKLLQPVDKIALRERKCYDIVKKCAPDKEVFITIDPTFLLAKEEYEPIIEKTALEKEPFIFTYTMPNDTQMKVYAAAEMLSKQLGIKVIDASGQPMMANKKIKDNRLCGPDEFLWYMKNADYVLTNSFHGTAFSIIMEKKFFVIPHSKTGNRAVELLEKMGLQDRYTNDGEKAVEGIKEAVDFVHTRTLKDQLVNYSVEYLKSCINE